ncbi:hypothetical protein OPT61_g4920 [Boeremia exigua]|uniref:Uncharacterized protein n=1 Tax=Boeremia exigua TaxID=749465 RepID=A0ACC2IC75_9PLEO|nr:hypothetical protein OPT61_g4920 [Boeremia exigua]
MDTEEAPLSSQNIPPTAHLPLSAVQIPRASGGVQEQTTMSPVRKPLQSPASASRPGKQATRGSAIAWHRTLACDFKYAHLFNNSASAFDSLNSVAMGGTTTPHDAIPGFECIAPSIWDRIPSTPSTPIKDISAPSLILLMTWTGAHGRHISKYTKEYATMFPSSHIMVITTSSADLVFRSSKRKQHRLQPAVNYIANLQHIPCCNTSGILMHVFSEGGSNKACELASAYQQKTGTRLPITALYLDSTPGHPRYLRLCSALAKSFPPIPVVKQLAVVIAATILGIIWVLYCGLIGYDNNVVTRSRKQLLDPKLFDLQTPRCYLYSKKDSLIAWQDIYEHAGESIEHSGSVTEVIFEDSDHVDHARKEPNRYWDAIITVWHQNQTQDNSEKGTRTTCTLRGSQLPEFDFEDGVTDIAIRMPSKAYIQKSRWSDADSQLTLLPSLPPTPSPERMLAVEQRLWRDGFI